MSFIHWQRFLDYVLSYLQEEESAHFNLERLSEELEIPISEIRGFSKILVSVYEIINKIRDDIDLKISKDELKFVQKKAGYKEISLSINGYQNISDIIYFFKNINKGRGFEINSQEHSSFRERIGKLKEQFPFLFRRLNGFIYPSEVGYKLGLEALSFKRYNQIPKELDILNFRFIIIK